MIFLAVVFLGLLASYGKADVNYGGYQLWGVYNSSSAFLQRLSGIILENELDIWHTSSHPLESTDLVIPPSRIEAMKHLLKEMDLYYETLLQDLNDAINDQRRVTRQAQKGMNWNNYHRLSIIFSWMNSLTKLYPSLVSIHTMGHSIEGRPIRVMKISSDGPNSTKPAAWIDGGIHAREWISPAAITFIANKLVSQVTSGNDNIIKYLDFYIAPVINPDGYEYSHLHDRLWRKNRSGPKPGALFGSCYGVDLNRNWNFHWGGDGSSGDPCSNLYRGGSAASELEVKVIQKFILERKEKFKLHLTVHSFGKMIAMPYGSPRTNANDLDELRKVANKAQNALNAHGSKYSVGVTRKLMHPASGSGNDWAKGAARIKFSYLLELPDRGNHGFLLPPNQIIPSSEEAWTITKSMAENVIEYYQLNRINGSSMG